MDTDTHPTRIASEVFQKLPGLVHISGLIELGSPESFDINTIDQYLMSSWVSLGQAMADESLLEFARIQQWCDAFRSLGVSPKDFPPSIKALGKRAAKGGDPIRINPIVDTYNAISMELGVPFGAYDIDQLEGPFRLKVASGGERFIALGSSENEPAGAGDIIYCDDNDVITAKFVWRQSVKAKITTDTKQFIFVCQLLDTMGPELAGRAQQLIKDKMESLLSAKIVHMSVETSK